MSNVKKQYLQEIKRLLPYDSAQKKHCVSELDHSVTLYLKDVPDASLEALRQKFGKPEDIASSYLERVDPEKMSRTNSVKRRLVICVACACAVIIVVFGSLGISYLNKVEEYHDGFYVEIFEETPPNIEAKPSPLTEN